jgi:predicted Zn-dependent protease
MDVYWWSGQNKKAVAIGKQALGNQINDAELGYKLAQAYNRMQNFKDSNRMMDSLLVLYPKNKEYSNFKKSLKK